MYKANPSANGKFITGTFPLLTEELQQSLKREYGQEEIIQALKNMGPLKAPGPNGLHTIFYQRAWGTVREDVCSMVLTILKGEKIHRSMAKALLVLIPKNEKTESIKHFCPISLYNVSFKLISKVLFNILKGIFQELISPNQSSFIPVDKLLIMS